LVPGGPLSSFCQTHLIKRKNTVTAVYRVDEQRKNK